MMKCDNTLVGEGDDVYHASAMAKSVSNVGSTASPPSSRFSCAERDECRAAIRGRWSMTILTQIWGTKGRNRQRVPCSPTDPQWSPWSHEGAWQLVVTTVEWAPRVEAPGGVLGIF